MIGSLLQNKKEDNFQVMRGWEGNKLPIYCRMWVTQNLILFEYYLSEVSYMKLMH